MHRGHIALVVNFFGGPGSGKTTAAARLFTRLKMRGLDVELIDEVARTCIQTGQLGALEVQPYLFGMGLYRLRTTARNTDVVIMDSPLLLNPIYDAHQSAALRALCLEEHNRFANLNVRLTRLAARSPLVADAETHSMAGRVHDAAESRDLDAAIGRFLAELAVPLVPCDGSAAHLDHLADVVAGAVPRIRQDPLHYPPGLGLVADPPPLGRRAEAPAAP